MMKQSGIISHDTGIDTVMILVSVSPISLDMGETDTMIPVIETNTTEGKKV